MNSILNSSLSAFHPFYNVKNIKRIDSSDPDLDVLISHKVN